MALPRRWASEDYSARAVRRRVNAPAEAERRKSGGHRVSEGESNDFNSNKRWRRLQTPSPVLQNVRRHEQLGPLFDHVTEHSRLFRHSCSALMNMHLVRLHNHCLPMQMPDVDAKWNVCMQAACQKEKEPPDGVTGHTLRFGRIENEDVSMPNLAGPSPVISFAANISQHHTRQTSKLSHTRLSTALEARLSIRVRFSWECRRNDGCHSHSLKVVSRFASTESEKADKERRRGWKCRHEKKRNASAS